MVLLGQHDVLRIGLGLLGYSLILFENQIQTTSASPCRTQVQPAASFLVCSLIFIEYCKAGLEEANTYFAQGGISSVTNLKVDNFEKHIEDTMIAGDWISDRAAVEKVVREAPSQIQELIKWGVEFDKKENGEFEIGRAHV